MRSLADIGLELQKAREGRGRTIEEVASQTHLKASHLRAIETGDETSLPEPVYVKSFIRKYATAVGLPGDELANQYWETKPLPPPPPQKQEIAVPWWIFPWAIAVLLIGVVIYFVAVAPRSVPEAGPLIAPPTSQPASPSAQPGVASPSAIGPASTGRPATGSPATGSAIAPAPTPMPSVSPLGTPAPSPAPVSSPRPTASPRPTPSPTPRATPVPPAPATVSVVPGEDLRVRLVVSQASWTRVIRDGTMVYEGVLRAGEAIAWSADEQLQLTIGNAGGVEVQVGDRSLGVLGARGEVVRRVFMRGDQQ